MIDAVDNTANAQLPTSSPDARLVCQAAAGLQKELSPEGHSIQRSPAVPLGNLDRQLTLVFLPLIDSPKLAARAAAHQASPIGHVELL